MWKTPIAAHSARRVPSVLVIGYSISGVVPLPKRPEHTLDNPSDDIRVLLDGHTLDPKGSSRTRSDRRSGSAEV
jgi:hypothetical protein